MWTGEWSPGTRPDVARAPSRAGLRTIEEVTRVFTGIVEELGRVVEVTKLADDSARLVVSGPLVTADAKHGDSIAVNGVCLTVVTLADGSFSADVMAETLHRSSLGALQPGDPVNLERPMAADGRFGGHIVQGHVDGLGRIRARRPSENWEVVEVELPEDLARFVVEKGSITVDGVSAHRRRGRRRRPAWFSVSLIPTTLTATTLGSRQVGDPVNLEVDVIAKYVERHGGGAGMIPADELFGRAGIPLDPDDHRAPATAQGPGADDLGEPQAAAHPTAGRRSGAAADPRAWAPDSRGTSRLPTPLTPRPPQPGACAWTASPRPSRRSRAARRSSSSTTRTARTRATSSSPEPARPPS